MDWIGSLGIDTLGALAHRHVKEISFALATAFSVVVGNPVNALVRSVIKSWNFLFRTAAFVLLFVAGYPLLTFAAQRFCRYVLDDQKPPVLLFLTGSAFLAFGFWADKQRP